MLHWLLGTFSALLSRGKLSILIYHQVLEQHDPIRPGEPDAQMFRWQMALLKRYFTPLSLPEALERLKENTLPANAVCVTFDDGYLDNLTVAQPILADLDIPATVYVATGFSEGTNMWNDRLIDLIADTERHTIDLSVLEMGQVSLGDVQQRIGVIKTAIGKLKYLDLSARLILINDLYKNNGATEYPRKMMNKSEIKALADSGVNIGAHTVNHPILKVLDSDQQQQQILQSRDTLQQWLQKPVLDFAYPNGVEGRDFDEVAVEHVQQAQFRSAVVTDWGVSSQTSSPFKLKRFTPWDQSPIKFHLRLIRNFF